MALDAGWSGGAPPPNKSAAVALGAAGAGAGLVAGGAASKALGAGVAAAAAEVEATNRKRKAEQTEAGPRLMRLEAEWVQGVKKNLEIEGHCMRLENECAALQKRRDARGGHG